MSNLENTENLQNYVNIGFCQPRYYTPTAWSRALKCMNRLVELGYVKPHDYGRGKGKFNTTEKGDEIGMGNIYKMLVKDNFILKIHKTRK